MLIMFTFLLRESVFAMATGGNCGKVQLVGDDGHVCVCLSPL